MSFIDDSEKNVSRLIETSAGGGMGGFVGTGGTRIDTLFAGGFHPDYGEIDKLHKQNLKSRKKRDSEEYGGESPVGGYYEVDTDFVLLAYDELDLRNQLAIEYSIENTPLADTEWKSTGWDYDYDEPGEGYSFKQPIYDKKPEYAGENFINKSEKNWELIKGI